MKIRMDYLRFAGALILALITVTGMMMAAQAQTPPTDLSKERALLEEFLKRWEQQASANGGKLVRDGDLKITPQSGYSNAALPYLRVMNADGGSFDIGIITVNISPDAAQGRWKLSIALPTPMIGKSNKGIENFRIEWGKDQKFSGIWDESLAQFLMLKAAYESVSLIAQDAQETKKSVVAFTGLNASMDMREESPGLWSGPFNLAVKNINAQLADGGTFKVSDATIEVAGERQNLLRARQLQQKMQDLIGQTQKAQQERRYDPTLDSALQQAVLDMILTTGEGLKMRLSGRNMAMQRPALGETPAQAFALAQGSVNAGAQALTQPLAQLDFGLTADGLVLSPEPSQNAGLTPAQVNVQFNLKKLPVRAIVDLLRNHMQASAAGSETPIGPFAMLFQLPPLLAQNGTVLDFQQDAARGTDYTFSHEGTAYADATAVLSFVAKSVMKVNNMDTIIARLVALGSPMADTLRTWKSAGRVSGSETIFDFELMPTGQLLVNGKDSATLFAPPSTSVPANPPTETQ
ncbi:MAG: hypothetical protein L6Q57_03395 [Alphaproteobacteria bacterium]|nr:hypothetical protein [Alphaproteobacteria bacterium]